MAAMRPTNGPRLTNGAWPFGERGRLFRMLCLEIAHRRCALRRGICRSFRSSGHPWRGIYFLIKEVCNEAVRDTSIAFFTELC